MTQVQIALISGLMGGRGVTMAANGVSADDAAHLLIFNPWVTLLGQCAYALVLAVIYWLYLPIVPPADMRLWAGVALIVFACVALLNLGFAIRRPDTQEVLNVWRAIDKRTPLLFDLIAALAIFLLFPHGDATMQMISVAFCVGYVPLQMISDPQNTFGNRCSVVIVLGSYAVWQFMQGQAAHNALGVMMITYGAVLFIAADAFRRVVVTAVAAKAESERSAAALAKMVDQVTTERDAKTRFIAAASHDLGQPLQAANLFAQNLVSAQDDTGRTRAANGVVRAVESAQTLLGNMLNHMRLEADAVTPNLARIELGEVIANCASQFEPSAQAAKIVLRPVASSRQVRADSSLLDRAMSNLLTNAIAHCGGSRIVIGVKSAGPDRVRLYVIDNGIGVVDDDVAAIFDDYTQGDVVRANAKGGFGLGLASVRRIATLLGGSAGLDTRWKGGAAFYIELPLEKATPS